MDVSKIIGCLILQPTIFTHKNCPVEDISVKLKSLPIQGYIKIFISGEGSGFMQEFETQASGQNLPGRIVLIAHGSKNNNSFNSKQGHKDASWWNVKESNDFIIAHSCYSAHILSHETWENKFKDWVGNSDKVWYSLDNVSAKIWPDFFKNMCLRFAEIKSGEEMKQEIEDLYFTSLYDNITSVDSIESYRTAIERNLSVLTYKKEFKGSKNKQK